jgi:hypothetical protein
MHPWSDICWTRCLPINLRRYIPTILLLPISVLSFLHALRQSLTAILGNGYPVALGNNARDSVHAVEGTIILLYSFQLNWLNLRVPIQPPEAC